MFDEKPYKLFNGDCLEILPTLPEKIAHNVLTDLPYGTTACSWDVVIPFEPMWAELKRIVKPKGAIVLFGSQPFTSALVASNLPMFKYEWIWKKNTGAGFLNAKNAPIKMHENIIVFSQGTTANCSPNRMCYFPQGLKPVVKKRNRTNEISQAVGGRPSRQGEYTQVFENFPTTIIKFQSDLSELHDTAKPVDLLRYLIRTYTQENEIVLDFTMGSGSTGVACMAENRKFIGIEKDEHYFNIAEARIKRANLEPCDIPQRRTENKSAPLFENLF